MIKVDKKNHIYQSGKWLWEGLQDIFTLIAGYYAMKGALLIIAISGFVEKPFALSSIVKISQV